MATNITTLPQTTEIADEELSTTTIVLTSNIYLTSYLLFIFPLYLCAVLLNFLSIYSILMAKIYRQYLSNVLLAVICIGALINLHGQIFLILIRWTNSSLSSQLCSSSIYLVDSGTILIHTHILFLAFERTLAYMKKTPANLQNTIIQKAHLFLIIMSLVSIILALTVPIYALHPSYYTPSFGLCLPSNTHSYKIYVNWIYYGFGHPLVWLSTILLGIFLIKKATISYATLIPMNRIILIISISSCINLIIRTILDDVIGISDTKSSDNASKFSKKMFNLMNFRDFISIIDKILIGVLFFIFRPEIRSWIYESVKKFQVKQNETMVPQMLDIRSEIDDNFRETDDASPYFPADI